MKPTPTPTPPPTSPTDQTAVERLAAIEHEQWMEWASTVAREGLTPERIERWQRFMVPYAELDEATKEHDRLWARKALAALTTTEPEQSAVERPIKHPPHQEGSRQHVLSWSNLGRHCSEPNCEVNLTRDDATHDAADGHWLEADGSLHPCCPASHDAQDSVAHEGEPLHCDDCGLPLRLYTGSEAATDDDEPVTYAGRLLLRVTTKGNVRKVEREAMQIQKQASEAQVERRIAGEASAAFLAGQREATQAAEAQVREFPRLVWHEVYQALRAEGVSDDHAMARADVARIAIENRQALANTEPKP